MASKDTIIKRLLNERNYITLENMGSNHKIYNIGKHGIESQNI